MNKSGGVSRKQAGRNKREYRNPETPGAVFFNAEQTYPPLHPCRL